MWEGQCQALRVLGPTASRWVTDSDCPDTALKGPGVLSLPLPIFPALSVSDDGYKMMSSLSGPLFIQN